MLKIWKTYLLIYSSIHPNLKIQREHGRKLRKCDYGLFQFLYFSNFSIIVILIYPKSSGMLVCKCLTTDKGVKELETAYFHGINILTMANFKLPMVLALSCKIPENLAISSGKPVQAGSSTPLSPKIHK